MKQDKYDGVLCALFEADGGAWKMEATERIKKYLESELKEYSDFTVISQLIFPCWQVVRPAD